MKLSWEQSAILFLLVSGDLGLPLAIDETMRYITFSLMTFREAKRDVTLNGYLIPKGWKVFVWYRAIHQDPEVYPNPRIFDPSRFDVSK
ncbi:hypothetical protein PIB30_003402 [Stylosanthes scabra]|uniref:Cytochrome P450 n=1 Tax=Stylosanthes scabra TaxID=79078 RepID=A0ABU6U2T3_9FABA|nr:hypothetical protein [Stylosanthes scabra]